MAVKPLISKRKTFVTDQRTNQDFAELLHYLSDDECPEAEKIVLSQTISTHILPRVCVNGLNLLKPDD